VDLKSKLGTTGSQPRLTQAFASSSQIVKCEVHRDTPHKEHQRPSYFHQILQHIGTYLLTVMMMRMQMWMRMHLSLISH
jgi:hypothetical protein